MTSPDLLYFGLPVGHTIYNFKDMDIGEMEGIIDYVINRAISKKLKPIYGMEKSHAFKV